MANFLASLDMLGQFILFKVYPATTGSTHNQAFKPAAGGSIVLVTIYKDRITEKKNVAPSLTQYKDY